MTEKLKLPFKDNTNEPNFKSCFTCGENLNDPEHEHCSICGHNLNTCPNDFCCVCAYPADENGDMK